MGETLSEVAAAEAPRCQRDDRGGPGERPEDEPGRGRARAAEGTEPDDDAGHAREVGGDLVERGLVERLERQRGRHPLAGTLDARDVDALPELLEEPAD